MTCTFFGHHDSSILLKEKLEYKIDFFIKEKSVTHFYIGNHGNFDAMALKTCVIKALKLCPISIEALEAVSKEELKDVIDEDIQPEYEIQLQKNSIANAVDIAKAELVETTEQTSSDLATAAINMTEEENKALEKAFDAEVF